jgi:hypothetical protein
MTHHDAPSGQPYSEPPMWERAGTLPPPGLRPANRHVGGVPWYDAPAPPRQHAHWAQTTGYIREGSERVERCACGAIRSDLSPTWTLLDAPRVSDEDPLGGGRLRGRQGRSVMPATRYGGTFDALADRWAVLEAEHDKQHPDRGECGGVGACSMMAAAYDLRTQMIDELEEWRR